MLFRDVIDLVWIDNVENEIGDSIEQEVPRQVFANRKSIRQSEFYQAAATGLKPEIMFEVRAAEYLDERQLIYDGRKYNILRVYSKNGEITELICTGTTGQYVRGDVRLDSNVPLDSDGYILGGSG